MLIDKRIHALAAAREVSARYVANDLPRPLPFGLHAKKIGASGHGRECAIGQKKSTGVASNCRQHLSGTNGSNPPPSSGESVANSIWVKAALPMRLPPRLVRAPHQVVDADDGFLRGSDDGFG
jgi:hypothetical protein